jgi:hypothetical protein
MAISGELQLPVILSKAKACPELVEGDPLQACATSGVEGSFHDNLVRSP